jgi:PAS domain S-box-containing protein
MAKKKIPQIDGAELRRRAEELLDEKIEAKQPPGTEGEPLRLHHELQVHQVELEMQNAELRQTRDELETALEQYTDLYEFAPVGYFTLDSTGTIIRVNLTGAGLVGVERFRLVGRRFAHLVVTDEARTAFETFLEKVFSSPARETCEVALRKKGHPDILVQIEAVAATSRQECRIALIDITDRDRGEVALQEVEEAAVVALQKVEAAAALARQKVKDISASALQEEREASNAVRLKKAATNATRMKQSTEVALRMVAAATEVARQKVEKASEVALHDETVHELRHGKESTDGARQKLKKSTEIARQMVERAAEVARQKVEETAEALLRALRRANEAESQIKLAEERLRVEELLFHSQKLESLGVLAGGIAHDFNNILTGILGNVSLAQMFLDETHKSYKPLCYAEKAALRAAELATQLLTFAKGGAPVKKPLSLAESIKESVSLALRGANVNCVVRVAEDLHAVEADAGQMSQVFHNIIINAVQAMPGGGTLTIGAENVTLAAGNQLALPQGACVRVTFADEGCGMAQEMQHKIFDPYYTTKSGGSGLGLASVHSIVRKHDGHIGVRSAVGSGTVFTLHLPSIGAAITPAASAEPSLAGGTEAKGKVLVMDDEALIRNLATQLLQHLGYGVTSCANGEEAVTLYGAAMRSGAPFLAAIIDLTIPGGMGGKEAAQRILAIDPAARLIVSSGYSSDPVMADFVNHGFCAAMAKPYRVADLARAMIGVNQPHQAPDIKRA